MTVVFDADFEPLKTYSLRVLSPAQEELNRDSYVEADLPAMIELMEERFEEMLPTGYQVRIVEWDK